MGWSRVRLRRRAVLALSVLLACGTVLGSTGPVAAVPTADEQARQWLERVSTNMGQPGRVFRSQLTIRERGEAGEVSSAATVWIDHEQRKSRFEVRRDNNLIGVTVVDNWEVAAYDAINNKVNNITVPEDARGNVRNPAYSVLAPSLVAAYQAGQINPEADVTTTTEQMAGRDATKLSLTVRVSQEVQAPPPPSGQQGGQPSGQPRTETIQINQEYTLWIDSATSLPIQESLRTSDGEGRELTTRTAVFEAPTLVERASVPGDTLSLQAVQGMLASIDQQVARARNIGFPLFWLGMELPRAFTDVKGQRQPALVLNDVQVIDLPNAPRQAIFIYGTRDEPAVPYVVLRQMQRAQFEEQMRQANIPPPSQIPGVQQQPVQVPGGQGTMYILQPPQGAGAAPPGGARGGTGPQGSAGGSQPALPPLMIVQITAGDAMAIVETPPLRTQDGRQGNPFLDQLQLAALAGALGRLN